MKNLGFILKSVCIYVTLFIVDMIGIPDFMAGAMENWGLVTYRETRILYDDRHNSIYDKRDVVNVICHELAHMWFGNLGKYFIPINYESMKT